MNQTSAPAARLDLHPQPRPILQATSSWTGPAWTDISGATVEIPSPKSTRSIWAHQPQHTCERQLIFIVLIH